MQESSKKFGTIVTAEAFYNLGNANQYSYYTGQSFFSRSGDSGEFKMEYGGGVRPAKDTINAIRFYPNTGTLTGYYKVSRVQESNPVGNALIYITCPDDNIVNFTKPVDIVSDYSIGSLADGIDNPLNFVKMLNASISLPLTCFNYIIINIKSLPSIFRYQS